MPFFSGQKLTAGQLDRLQPVPYEAVANGSLTSTTTTETDIPGASITFTTKAANATFQATGTFDCEPLAVSSTIMMLGKLNVDGVGQSGVAVHRMNQLDRDTVSMTWTGVLAAAGSHTLKLRGNLSANLAVGGRFQTGDTKLQFTITEVV
ncbi:hypothetical protein [Streptomyces sp.]|uniref:hypothetical protein n=1 Tax=Streptomyces sp. TaxID=1931 RepID=UPI002D79C454|nr:hypothetical protein [Streptomyces sp.]HET6356101.1 hypothetical protein [Streptomyces sp.]